MELVPRLRLDALGKWLSCELSAGRGVVAWLSSQSLESRTRAVVGGRASAVLDHLGERAAWCLFWEFGGVADTEQGDWLKLGGAAE